MEDAGTGSGLEKGGFPPEERRAGREGRRAMCSAVASRAAKAEGAAEVAGAAAATGPPAALLWGASPCRAARASVLRKKACVRNDRARKLFRSLR